MEKKIMLTFHRMLSFISALSFLASGATAACVQSNLSTGLQKSGAAYVLYIPEISCWNGNMVVWLVIRAGAHVIYAVRRKCIVEMSSQICPHLVPRTCATANR